MDSSFQQQQQRAPLHGRLLIDNDGAARVADAPHLGHHLITEAAKAPSNDAMRVTPGSGSEGAPSGSAPRTEDLAESREDVAGVTGVTNADFIDAVFGGVPEGAVVVACSKAGDPTHGSWDAMPASQLAERASVNANNYVGCSSFYTYTDGKVRAKKEQFAACHAFMLDDVGTKVSLERLAGLELSWHIETSPGNHQGGIILADPITDAAEAKALHDAIIEAGLCDPGAGGPAGRWARQPVGINGKPKHRKAGEPFRCRLVEWRPDRKYTVQQIIDGLGLTLKPRARPKALPPLPAMTPKGKTVVARAAQQVLTLRPDENPVVTRLKARGQYKKPLGQGKHDVTCPWVDEHTDAVDSGTAYFEPSDAYPIGGFCCQHSHREQYHIGELLADLGMSATEAQHKPLIRVVDGQLDAVAEAAELALARAGSHFLAGDVIVSISVDPSTGDPRTVPVSTHALTRDLSASIAWEKFDGRKQQWVPCDPPQKHVAILHDAQTCRHLPALVGIARQPYFRESDGELVMTPGYDPVSQRYGVFDPAEYDLPEPTEQAARDALALLEALLAEFRFVSRVDLAAALAAIITAVVRPVLDHAPAFHVRAPVMGSGKSYLCELIAAFASAAGSAKVSYPTTAEEASKVLLSLLLTSPAVIEFDDMTSDWTPHGVMNRALTATWITERVLGVSRTATVSTRTLWLGSGNNVEPVRDLRRRVLTIRLDPRCAAPATIAYAAAPVARVRAQRGKYVAAVLTIIRAWRAAGSPMAKAASIATYGGAWSTYCRQPLMWLGHCDPATTLIEQIRHDPDAEALERLLAEWHDAFDSVPTTLREAVSKLDRYPALDDAIGEFPVKERGAVINVDRLGWILKKNADRIVGGFQLKAAMAQGRRAWRVVTVVSTPASPALPASGQAAAKSRELQAADCTLDDLGCLWPSTSHSPSAAFPAANTTACETDDGLPPF